MRNDKYFITFSDRLIFFYRKTIKEYILKYIMKYRNRAFLIEVYQFNKIVELVYLYQKHIQIIVFIKIIDLMTQRYFIIVKKFSDKMNMFSILHK